MTERTDAHETFDEHSRAGYADPRLALVEALEAVGPSFARWVAALDDETTVSYAQGRLLRLLQRRGPQTPTGLADALGVRQPSVSGLLDPLMAEGLVRRTGHPSDRRSVLVEVTEAGARLDWALPRTQAAAELFAGFDDEEVLHLLGALKRVAGELRNRATSPSRPRITR